MTRLRLGTRGSALARAQANIFADELRAKHRELEVELTIIRTSGDAFSERLDQGDSARDADARA